MSKRDEDLILPSVSPASNKEDEKKLRVEMSERVKRIAKEFEEGFRTIRDYPKSVSFFGSARACDDDFYYSDAKEIAKRLSELGYAIVTGGGLGVMEAANKGAHDAGGHSVGLNIKLPQEQSLNRFVTDNQEFHYFFSRKMILSFSAESYLFFPGGFGTLDEFFEIITLIQTHKVQNIPVICFGSDFWNPVMDLLSKHLLDRFHTISPEDLNIITTTDDIDEVIEIVKKVPVRKLD